MSKLNSIDKSKLEKIFGMDSGYVLDFSDRTFQEFIYESIHIDINSEKYNYRTGSKANRLRGFWKVENNKNIAMIIIYLLQYWKDKKIINGEDITNKENLLYEECKKIANKLYSKDSIYLSSSNKNNNEKKSILPKDIRSLIKILVLTTSKSILPLKRRRNNSKNIDFNNEYDYQDFLHSMLIPWIKDIRPEEYTPSYAGTSKRVDFLLKDHSMFIEIKYVRDKGHARKIGDEITIDIHHYQSHPKCRYLVAVIYDPNRHILNPDGFIFDLSKKYISGDHELDVEIFISS